MGKALVFILTTFTLFMAEAKQCISYFKPLVKVSLKTEELQKINWFYDSNPSHGYISQGSHLRWVDLSNKLKPEERIEIPYMDGRFVTFHRLRKGSVGQNFAAVAGVGVVNVKLINVRTSGQFDKYLKAKLKMIDFFTAKGFVSAPITYMDHFFSQKINKWVVVSWYNPGISYKQLDRFLDKSELSQAQLKYEQFVDRVNQALISASQPPIRPNKLRNYVEKYAIYFNNSWSFNFF